jgi:hypothetical protein
MGGPRVFLQERFSLLRYSDGPAIVSEIGRIDSRRHLGASRADPIPQ